MRVGIFSARKTQRQYAAKLAVTLKQAGFDTTQFWYKSIPVVPGMIAWVRSRVVLPPSVISNYIRERRNRTPNTVLPLWKVRLLATLKSIEAKFLLFRYYQEFRTKQCDYLILWNGLKFRQEIACAAAKALNIPCIYIERGALPGTTMFDPKGINFINSVPRDPEFFRLYQPISKASWPEQIKRDQQLPDNFLFIPCQVNTDSQIVRFSPWIRDMHRMIDALLEAENNLGKKMPNIIIKTHPACSENYSQLINRLNNESKSIRLIEQGNTSQLIQHADAIATINSSVGLEALQNRKKVIVMGEAFYNISGITISAQNQRALEQALLTYTDWEPEDLLLENFLSYLEHEYTVPGRWQDASDEHLLAILKHFKEIVTAESCWR